MVRSCKKLRGQVELDWTNIGPKAGRRVVKPRKRELGSVAQLVEHLTFNQRVAGSSPARLTRIFFFEITGLNNLILFYRLPQTAVRQSTTDAAIAGLREVESRHLTRNWERGGAEGFGNSIHVL